MMESQDAVTRRSMLAATAAGGGWALTAALTGTQALGGEAPPADKRKARMKLRNSDFYDGEGTFDGEKARQAYFDMMKRFHYPITKKLTKEAWGVDFGLGDFVNVGLGGIFWVNDAKYKYFGHEIFLLPGQMIVEHAHVQAGEVPPKMETWHVRHGMIYTFGEGEPTKPCPVKTPASQAKFITARHVKSVALGEMDALGRPTAKHFMLAGPEGAIVTEYATFHDNAALRFTNPRAKL